MGLISCAILILFLAIQAGPARGQQRTAGERFADIVFHNGKVLTVDSRFAIAEAVAILDGRFKAVGKNEEVLKLAGPGTLLIDLKGRTAIPGLIDTHFHLHDYAEAAYGGELGPTKLHRYPVDWKGVKNKDDALGRIKGLMDQYKFKPGEWIYFVNRLQFMEGGEADQAKILYDDLNRWELDKVTPDNPVVLSLGIPDFNGVLVNSKALDAVWQKHRDFIQKYGRYWRDSSGRPDGHLEPPASRIILDLLPSPSPEELAPIYKKYIDELSSMGVTTVSTRMPAHSVDAYKLLESKGEMALRLGYGMEWLFGNITDPQVGLKEWGKAVGTGSDKIWVTSVAPTAVDGAGTRACTDQKRVSAFGAIDRWWPAGQCHADIEFSGAQGKGAAIRGNYLKDWMLSSARYGVRFANTHVAGDKSVRLLLDFIEEIQRDLGSSATRRWAFDHCTLVNPEDFKRAARLGIVFSCAPKYIESVAPNAARAYGERVANTFVVPVKSMLDSGVKVVFEADRDVYIWHDLELLMTRKGRDGKVWGPQERIDRITALKMITSWAADYLLKGEELGSIEPGKLADLVVIDRDYLTVPEDQIGETQALMTVLGGKIVYVHPEFAQEYNLRPSGAVIATYKELIARRNRFYAGVF